MAGYKVEVAGLRDLRRALKRAGDEFPKKLRDTNFAVADRVVVPAARRKAAATPRPHAARPGHPRQHWGDYVQSIRALASQTRATVALGAARIPWAVGANFGSRRFAQFPATRKPDYALFSAIGEQRHTIIETYGDMLEDLIEILEDDSHID